ncbi:MAG: hypothetical protein Alpg2KO_20950 [Alphaproteobacteria bacterium]
MSDNLLFAAPLLAGPDAESDQQGEGRVTQIRTVELSGASIALDPGLFQTQSESDGQSGDSNNASGTSAGGTISASNAGPDTPVFVANDDFGNDETTEDVLAPEDLVEGTIETPGDEDWFLMELKSNFFYVLDLQGVTLVDPIVFFGDQQGDIVLQDDNSGTGNNAELLFTVDDPGDYFAVAASANNGTGTYEYILVEVDDFSSDTDTTGELTGGSSLNGSIDLDGDIDAFSVDGQAGVTYQIVVDAAGDGAGDLADAVLEVRDGDGNLLASDDNSGTGNDPFLSFTPNSTSPFLILVKSKNDTGTGSYTISLVQDNRDPEVQAGSFVGVLNTDLEDSLFGLAEDPDGDELTFSLFTDGSDGTVTVQADGTFTYDPDNGFTGADSFVYRVSDGNGGTATETVSITITDGSNLPPVVNDGDISVNEDELFSGNLNTLTSDPDGDDLTFSLVGEPANGTAVVNADGTFTYLGGLDFEGVDDFRFQVTDGTYTITRVMDITVNGVFDDPTARDDTFSTDEDVNLSGDVSTNDNPGDAGNPAGFVLVTGVSRGNLIFNNDGSFDYQVDEDFNGTQSFTYRISDGFTSDTASVTITVNSINDRPGAGNAELTTDEDTPVSFDLTENDTAFDIDEGEALTFTVAVDPSNGSVNMGNDGNFTYTPDENFSGTDSFTYRVSDPGGLTDTAVITITITPVNDRPEATNDSFSAVTNADINGDVSTNDVDVDGDDLTYAVTVQPATGTLNFNADGSFTYTPEDGFEGSETFTYSVSDGSLTDTASVTLQFTGVNDPPTANDDTYTTGEDTPLQDDVTDNDTDPDLTALDVSLITDVSNGTLVLNEDGTFTYTPDAQYVGPDSFSYRVSDGEFTDTATVSITVTLVNDTPIANNDTATVAEDDSTSGNVLTNDTDEEDDDLTASLATQASNGTATVAANGAFTYTPDEDFNGTDSFTYQVTDGNSTSTGTVMVTVTPVNDPPEARNDSFDGDEDEEVTGSVADNDINVDNDSLTYTVVSSTSRGSLSLNDDGSFTYTPVANSSGTDSFTYRVSDGDLTDTATATLNIAAVNDAPVAQNDTGSGVEDNQITGNVINNDSDVENDLLTASLLAQASNGTAVVASDGSYIYTPDDDFFGTDSFTYRVSDGDRQDTGTVTVTVTPVDDEPVARNDSFSVDEDDTLSASVASNDIEVDGDDLTFGLVSNVSNGSLSLNTDGSFTYTGDAEFSGTDSFTYSVTDGNSTDTATATITVNQVNDAPVGRDDSASGNEDDQITGNVLSNDSDIENDDLTASLTTGPSDGQVVVNQDGSFTYTPDDDFNGTDSFVYTVSDGNGTDTATVTVTVNPVQDAPVAGNDAVSGTEDNPITGNVSTNDSDVDGDDLTYSVVSGPDDGQINLNSNGSFTYTPDANFNGQDSFTYRVSDGVRTDTATVTITVAAVNDAPVAVNDSRTGNENSNITGNVLANDTDIEGDDLSATLLGQPANGAAIISPGGSFVYTPNPGFTGVDSFTYQVSDGNSTDTGTVTVTVLAVNDPPRAVADSFDGTEDEAITGSVAANDSDPEDDNLTFSLSANTSNGSVSLQANGSFTYTPDANFNGTDSFTYIVSDGDLTDTATVTLTVAPVNDAPVAVADTRAGEEDSTINGNLIANDTDADGDDLTASLVSGASNGSVTVSPGGSFLYTPDANFSGTDSFVYRVSDGELTDTATVTVIVGPVDDGPVAVNDSYEADEDQSISNTVAENDFDGDGDALSFSLLTGPENGELTLNADGSFTFTPDANFSGTDSFTYRLTAGEATDTATVTLTFNPINDAPVAVHDSRSGDEDTDITGNLLANDTDVEGDDLTASLENGPSNGSVTISPGGSFRYTPDANFSGTDSFTYRVSDGEDTDIGTVTVTVTPVEDAPVAEDDAIDGIEDSTLTSTVADNDSDGDGDALTYSLVTGPASGALGLNADGSFTYTPEAEFSGQVSFVYRVSDGDQTDTATATLTIANVNDAPVANPDSRSGVEGQVISGNVLANDTDIDSQNLTASLAQDASNGSVAISPGGSFVYTPDQGFNGTDSFTYTVSDGELTDTATVTVFVAEATDSPVANPDSFATDEDTELTATVALNDFDGDGDDLAFALVSGPQSGDLTLNTDGSFSYTPATDASGTDSFVYRLTAGGETATATASITIRPVNDAPVAVADNRAGEANEPISGNLLANDSDVDGDDLSASLATQAGNGTVTVSPGGSFVYTPDTDFSGTDSFTYRVSDGDLTDTATVTLFVGQGDLPPEAANDSFAGDEDEVVSGSVATNDFDANDDPLSYALISGPASGDLQLQGNGDFTYTPDAEFSGQVSFTYRVTAGGQTDTATATITIAAVTDRPDAVDDTGAGDEDTQITGNVLRNDSDVEGDDLTATRISGPQNGSLTLSPGGSYVYTPDLNFNGTDSFVYQVSDGTDISTATVSLTIAAVNDAPIARADSFTVEEETALNGSVGDNDTDIEGDDLTFSLQSDVSDGTLSFNDDGSFSYTSGSGFEGQDSFTYSVSDGQETDTATVTITVSSVNDAPTAVADSFVGQEGEDITGNLLSNDTDPENDDLTAALVAGPDNGSVTVSPGGSFRYTPDDDFTGTDSFTYRVSDGELTDTATVTVLVAEAGAPPVARDDSFAIDEDELLTGTVGNNDADPSGNGLIFLLLSGVSNGALNFVADGSFTYTPDAEFSGSDSFTYRVTDGENTDSATVTITVAEVNDSPIAVDDSRTGTEDTDVTGNVLANDSDPEGDDLSASLNTGPSNGTVTVSPGGSFRYTPDTNFSGTDSFTYRVSDGNSSDTATVTITIVESNEAPVGQDDEFEAVEDQLLFGDVSSNDSDGDEDNLTFTLITDVSNGSLTLNADGSFEYTPSNDFNGTDSFSYRISDGTDTDTATVTLTVTPVEDAPVAVNDSFTGDEDAQITGNVLGNDSDGDGDALTTSLVSGPDDGQVVLNASGDFIYTPDPQFAGEDSFSYRVSDGDQTDTATVTITVEAVNDAPIARDDLANGAEDTQITGSVATNDSDEEGDALTFSLVTGPDNGMAVVNADGSFTYTPDANFSGTDSLVYRVSDGNSTSTATLRLTVTPVNDAPVAVADTAAGNEDTQITGNVLGNDTDADEDDLSVTLVTGPDHGILTLNADGSFGYTPVTDYSGTDTFTYRVSDGSATDTATVTLTITATNDAPIARSDARTLLEDGGPLNSRVDLNDTDAEGDDLTFSLVSEQGDGTLAFNADGSFTFTPDADDNGEFSFVYRVSDGEDTDTATVTLTILPVNDAPTADDDAFNAPVGSALRGSVAGNDADPEGDDLTYTLISTPAKGSLSLLPDGSFSYIADPGETGTDSFSYRVSDGEATDTATVTLTLTDPNDRPVAQDDSFDGTEGSAINGNVQDNDSDADNDALTASVVQDVANGTLVLNADGSFTYTPDADFAGTDSFVYRVSDGDLTDTATVTLTVANQNDAPVANADTFIAARNLDVTGNVLGNDRDADGDALTVTLVDDVDTGTLVLNADGSFTYSPQNNFTGTDTFIYRISDGEETDTATVTLDIRATNDAPTAVNDMVTLDEDDAASFDVSANDTDPEGGALTVTLVGDGPDNGQLVLNADGTALYTPDQDFNGTDSFTYRISDGQNTDTATVSMTVNPVADRPIAVDDTITTAEDTAFDGNVILNDSDGDDDALTVSVEDRPQGGQLTLNADGTFTYTPFAHFNGQDAFTYILSDGGLTSRGTVVVTVTPVDDAPIASNDRVQGAEGQALNGNVGLNDVDVDGDALTFSLVEDVENGSLTLNADGSFSYTPDASFSGTDSFTYRASEGDLTDTATVTIVITPENDAPVAQADSFAVDEDTRLDGSVASNDSDADGDSLLFQLVTGPDEGVLQFNADGSFSYTGGQDFNGSDSFDYRVIDGIGGSDTATATITVNPVNDTPIALTDLASGPEEQAVSGNVLRNDRDPDGDDLTASLRDGPSNGSAVVTPGGSFVYTPDDNFVGTDSFTYTVSDGQASDTGTVIVTITDANDAPIARNDSFDGDEDQPINGSVASNDSDPDGGELTFSLVGTTLNGGLTFRADGSFTYVPGADFNGTDSFTYAVSDGALTDTATVSLTVNAVNDAPVAVDDTGTGFEDQQVTGNVLRNDSDIDGDDLSASLATGPSIGSAIITPGGSFVYTPDDDFDGTDSFTYRVTDGNATSTGTVTVTLEGVNDAPIGALDVFEVDPNATSTGQLTADDPDGDEITYRLDSDALNGTATVSRTGRFTYTPDRDFSGEDTFRYAVSDGQVTEIVTVLMQVGEVQDDLAGDEVGDTLATAGDLDIDIVTDGRIGHRGDRDLYGIEVSEGGTYVIQALGLSSGNGTLADPFLRLFGRDGERLVEENDNAGDGSDAEIAIVRLTFSATQDGIFYVQVSASGDDALGDYRVVVNGSDFVGTDDGDIFVGGEADDVLVGGRGQDVLDGRGGADEILGGRGKDTLFGGDGNDEIRGGNGNDRIEGGAGEDDIDGGRGDDTAFGGDDADVMRGNAGDDVLVGELGDDQINGSGGEDLLKGNGGNDLLEGAKDNDVLEGGSGTDTLVGGKGRDILTGGIGKDFFAYKQLSHSGKLKEERDRILDFNTETDGDVLDLSGIEGSENFILVDAPSGAANEMWQDGNRFKLDTTGNGVANLQIELPDFDGTLTIDDFIL